MTFFKGHPLGFLHPVNIIKTLPNNEEKGLRASQLKKPEKERVRGFKGSRGRVVLLESFFKSEKRKSQRIPNQRNQRNQRKKGFEDSRIQGVEWKKIEGWRCCKKSEKKGVEDLEKRSEKTLLTLHTLQAEGGRG